MPHIIVKLYPGKTEAQKQELTAQIVAATIQTLKVTEHSISVAFEEVSPEHWNVEVYQPEIIAKEHTLYQKPGYKQQ